MDIRIASTYAEIAACYPVMRELRPHLTEEQFVQRVRCQELSGYQLAYLLHQKEAIAVAGFRISENLAWGRHLYVDDLVTLPAHRSKGVGKRFLSWLKQVAAKEKCQQIHLDSGTQRTDAHRFYEREGMEIAGFHFVDSIAVT